MNTATEEETVTLGYSGGNQLTSVTDNDSGGTALGAQFVYDGLGRLAQKKDGSGNVLATYYYDGTALAYEVTPTGTVTYQWAGGKLLSQRPTVGGASHTYWYLLDALGNAKALLDGADQNRLKAVYVYGGFGNLQPSSFEDLDIENPLRYRANAGYMFLMEPQQEVEYALYNAGARTYNTDTGRWLQEDPVVGIPTDPMSFNRYLYCNADPINYDDPSGLSQSFGSGRAPSTVTCPAPAPSQPAGLSMRAWHGPTCPGWNPCDIGDNHWAAVPLILAGAGGFVGVAPGAQIGGLVGSLIGGAIGAVGGGLGAGAASGGAAAPEGAAAGAAVGALGGGFLGSGIGAVAGGAAGAYAGDLLGWNLIGHSECFDDDKHNTAFGGALGVVLGALKSVF